MLPIYHKKQSVSWVQQRLHALLLAIIKPNCEEINFVPL